MCLMPVFPRLVPALPEPRGLPLYARTVGRGHGHPQAGVPGEPGQTGPTTRL